MKTSLEEVTETEVDQYEEFQLEESMALANEFIDEKIIPELYAFECENDNEDYIEGIATVALFARLCTQLVEEGYSISELERMVTDFGHYHPSTVMH